MPAVGLRAGPVTACAVVWLQTTGLPEALDATVELFPAYGTGADMTRPELLAWMRRCKLDRLASLAEVGKVAAFMASDHAAAMTATSANLTCGAVPAR